jgi:ATP-dependent Clp protease adaptor protein ClpS
MPDIDVPTVRPKKQRKTKEALKPKNVPMYHVVLLNDDDHTYEYVIQMLGELFGHPPPKAFLMADEVHHTGRVIVYTTYKEQAEFKRDRIHAYGADPRLARCKGSMSAIIEPADDVE